MTQEDNGQRDACHVNQLAGCERYLNNLARSLINILHTEGKEYLGMSWCMSVILIIGEHKYIQAEVTNCRT